jgi:hypothetical protein
VREVQTLRSAVGLIRYQRAARVAAQVHEEMARIWTQAESDKEARRCRALARKYRLEAGTETEDQQDRRLFELLTRLNAAQIELKRETHRREWGW